MLKATKRLCPGCGKRRKDTLFPKHAMTCDLCKIAKRVEVKKETATTAQLDDLVRRICRKEWGDMPKCVVCGLESGYSNPHTNPHGIQIGHYISRAKFILRWDFNNLYPNCARCNRCHEDNPLPFTLYILRTHGQDRLNYYESKLKEYEGGKWLNQNRKNEIKKELEQYLEDLS